MSSDTESAKPLWADLPRHPVRPETLHRIEQAARDRDAVPWWRPFKSQEAARRHRYALLQGAYEELGL